eukprot:3535968-Amphidinium_carterae.1
MELLGKAIHRARASHTMNGVNDFCGCNMSALVSCSQWGFGANEDFSTQDDYDISTLIFRGIGDQGEAIMRRAVAYGNHGCVDSLKVSLVTADSGELACTNVQVSKSCRACTSTSASASALQIQVIKLSAWDRDRPPKAKVPRSPHSCFKLVTSGLKTCREILVMKRCTDSVSDQPSCHSNLWPLCPELVSSRVRTARPGWLHMTVCAKGLQKLCNVLPPTLDLLDLDF